MAKHQEQLKKQ